MKRSLNLVAGLLLVFCAILGSWPLPKAQAYSLPSSPGLAVYVETNWRDVIQYRGQGRFRAYQKGWDASMGGSAVIILSFGRQLAPTDSPNNINGAWGVKLHNYPLGQGQVNNQWVSDVSNAFIQGYNDNPAHSQGYVLVGTTNANYSWTCINTNANPSISANWKEAGRQWGAIVANLTIPSKVFRGSGNDIESWKGFFSDGWTACGKGAEKWFDGYAEIIAPLFQFPAQIPYNWNYSSNGYVEKSTQWNQAEVHDVMYGRAYALGIPQIYCSGQPAGWVAMASFRYILYSGVTSENSHTTGGDYNGCNGAGPNTTYT